MSENQKGFAAFLAKKDIVFSAKRYGIDALGAMAQGLFASLLIGTILKTLGQQLGVAILVDIGTFAQAVTGPAMAVSIGYALKCPPLVLFSLIAVGGAANQLGGAGGPLAVFVVTIFAAEFGKLVSKETKVDIIVTPSVTICVGVLLSMWWAPSIGAAASAVGNAIKWATELQPFFMGILVSVIVGIALTLPISSAAICAALGLTGLAGGAAVAAAIYALAANQVKVNVTGVIPMCENRISPSALVPGDVIGSYGGKKIEICNTDAEGRLILADAMAYMVKDEHADRVIDIATLTGAVVGMLGFSTAGLLSDDDAFCGAFLKAAQTSGERYWRLPIFEEQKQMIESKIADIKNMGRDYCGTITAGLFIQAFAQGRPWIHLDIAGTAWTDNPLYQGQPQGATAAGTSSLYYLLAGGEETCF